MRLFLAVEIPTRSRELLQRKVDILKDDIEQDIKWVKPDNWHLTLKFLGETAEGKVHYIQQILDEMDIKWQQEPVQLKGIAAFPHVNKPRVIVTNVKQGFDILLKLHAYLDKELQKYGFKPEERAYKPHLTLARARRSTDHKLLGRKLKKYINKPNFINIYLKLFKITLMKSNLTPSGPEYHEVYSINTK